VRSDYGSAMSKQQGWRAYAPDVVLPVVVGAFVLAGSAFAPVQRTELNALGVALIVVGALGLAALRRAPVPALLVATTAATAYLASGYPGVGVAIPVMFTLFVTARHGYKWLTLFPKAGLVLVIVMDFALGDGTQPTGEAVFGRIMLVGWLLASVFLGAAFRQWGAYVREAEQRAAEAEQTREETARRRASEERLRIARELHDSLTHTISIIKVHAGVAVHLARKRGEEVPAALLAVQEASGEAMRELRATLAVLREDGTGAPGLAKLEDLVERARSAGLPADVKVVGVERPLPAEVDRTAFRIVQEALTNIARHAGPASAVVRIEYGADDLTVQVDDDGRGAAEQPGKPGLGLVGMRERVAELGGKLRTGPRPEGGFQVLAELPLGDTP
jgi:signal transduction histidine kinase